MIKREATALQFSNSILGWTISQSVQSMMHKVQQSFGLGLAIVKATMDLHKQSCIAQNTPDGLQISFTLPLVVLDE